MTNEMIIFMKRCELMEQGIIGGTGRLVEIEINDELRRLEEPEEIHTYEYWKKIGYQVRKGEKSQIKFTIWTYKKGKAQIDEETGEEVSKGRLYPRQASFFTIAQCDKKVSAN